MRKISIYLATVFIAIFGVLSVANAHTTQSGDTLWKIARNANLSLQDILQLNPQIENPDLIYVGQEINTEQMIGAGYTPITGYDSRTTEYISASATTIPVVDTKDRAGNQIVLSNISSAGIVRVYMNLAAGTSKEEPIVCTGLTATSWTNCTRGLVFQGSSETSSSTIANPHNAGTKIIITNIGQFFNQYVSVDGTQTINDVKTFTSFPQFNTSTQLPTANGEFATKYYVDNVGAGGFTSVNVSTTRGLSVDGSSPEKVGINASSTTGMTFDSSGKLYQKLNPYTFNHGDWNAAGGLAQPTGTYAPLTTGTFIADLNKYIISSVDPTIDATNKIILDEMAVLSGGTLSATEQLGFSNGRIMTPITSSSLRYNVNGINVEPLTIRKAIASTTPTANTVPIANSSGNLDYGWYSGTVQTYTAGESIDTSLTPIPVYLGTDGKVYKTSSNFATNTFPFIGFASDFQNVSADEDINVQVSGNVFGFTGLTPGAIYYISTTGTVSTTAGTVSYKVARAVTPAILLIEKGAKSMSGVTSFSSTATTTIYVGFKPSSITIFTSIADTATYMAISNGGWDATNGNKSVYRGGQSNNVIAGSANTAYSIYVNTASSHIGLINNITTTGFDISNVKANTLDDVYIYWKATE